MKKIGKFNLIEENTCKLKCDCGWNITIGGQERKDLKRIKIFLRDFDKCRCQYNKAKKYISEKGLVHNKKCPLYENK